MIDAWAALKTELSIWNDTEMTLPFWWRDDDAVSVTVPLDKLNALSEQMEIPVHLAVVPKYLQPDLVTFLDDARNIVPVMHGWAHQNHAPEDQKKTEFGDHRPIDAAIRDIRAGVARMMEKFGDRFVPMFVPPWNRINPVLLPELPSLGLRAISTFTSRKATFAAPKLMQINTHFDPVAWKSDKGLIKPDILIAQLVGQLQDRRAGLVDATEPLGLLTHHLVHDPEIWEFCAQLLDVLRLGPIKLFDGREVLNKKENS